MLSQEPELDPRPLLDFDFPPTDGVVLVGAGAQEAATVGSGGAGLAANVSWKIWLVGIVRI